jgi:hypothetical protein
MAKCIFIIESNNHMILSHMYLNYNNNAYIVILYDMSINCHIIRYLGS